MITRADLRRMRALGLRRYGRQGDRRPSAWGGGGRVETCIHRNATSITLAVYVWQHKGPHAGRHVSLEAVYPDVAAALDDLPRITVLARQAAGDRACSCGLCYAADEWAALRLVSSKGEEGEYRNCTCTSTLVVPWGDKLLQGRAQETEE